MATWQLDPDVTHLNHGSFGACPTEVLAVQAQLRHDMERNPVAFMLRQYQPGLEASRTALAAFVQADAEGLVFVPNATYGVNSVLRSIESQLAPGSEIVISDHTYNACANAAKATAARIGGSVRVAKIPFPIESGDQVVAAVRAEITPKTGLVMIDHVTSATGLVMPIHAIVAALEPDVRILVDGAHAPGMIDVDLNALGASFYTANCHKWICAPKGAAFLWVDERHRATTTAAAISHGFNDGWPGSQTRFHAQFDWTGTDDPTARMAVAAALDVMSRHHEHGWTGLRQENHELALAGRTIVADALAVTLPAPDAMIGSIASLPVPPLSESSPSVFDPLTDELHRRWSIEVPVFAWPESPNRLLRISAQQYNTVADYERLAHALRSELAIG